MSRLGLDIDPDDYPDARELAELAQEMRDHMAAQFREAARRLNEREAVKP